MWRIIDNNASLAGNKIKSLAADVNLSKLFQNLSNVYKLHLKDESPCPV
jgi:hypothetical protein